MDDETIAHELAARYLRFAESEVAYASPRYQEWARTIAADPELLGMISSLPAVKQQPNLVFASVRWCILDRGADVPEFGAIRNTVVRRWDDVRACALSHQTQTNEARRLATLLPFMVELAAGEPVALLELGASMGLCLQPDRWRYRYGDTEIGRQTDPLLECELGEGISAPARPLAVSARAGIDLHPLSVHRGADIAWMETLIWPRGERGAPDAERLARLRSAVDLGLRHPVEIVRGDLVQHGTAMAEQLRSRARTVIVFHAAVLAYVHEDVRRAFTDDILELVEATRGRDGEVHWIANEGRGIVSAALARKPSRHASRSSAGAFDITVDGVVRGVADPHGAWVARR